MKANRIIGLVVILFSIGWSFRDKLPSIVPVVPLPAVPAIEVPQLLGDTLKAGFSGRKPEAGAWAGLLAGMARAIEADASHPEGPRLRTMADIERLRDWVIQCPPRPIAGGETIGQALGPEIAKLGTSTEELDKGNRRASLVKLFDGSSQVLEGVK
jgi:hypothetical protein